VRFQVVPNLAERERAQWVLPVPDSYVRRSALKPPSDGRVGGCTVPPIKYLDAVHRD